MKIGKAAVVVAAGVFVAVLFSCGQSETEINLGSESEVKTALSSMPESVISVPDEVKVDNPFLENTKEERTEDFIFINLQYPVLSGTRADTIVNGMIEQDKQNMISQVEEGAEFIKQNSSRDNVFSMTGRAELVSVWDYTEQGNMVSVITQWNQYTGGAHNYYFNIIYTFDKESPRVYGFSDLFKYRDGVDYVTDYIKSEMDTHPDDYMEYSYETLETYQGDYEYYINGNTINVIFPPYDLQCFAEGITMYSFDASQLRNWLKPEIYSMIKDGKPKQINKSVINNE